MEAITPLEAPLHKPEYLPQMPPGQIVGRNAALGHIFAQVRAGIAVLLHGPAGVGKSALAATIASAFTTFPGGVLWWRVEDDSLAQLVARLGRAYQADAISDSADPLQHLAAAQALLNGEHKPLLVLDGRLDLDVVRDFMRQIAPGIPAILVNEAAAPGPWVPLPVPALEEADAIALLMQTARLDQGANMADLRSIAAVLDGLPLALRLAGLHLRTSGETPGDFLGTLSAPGGGGPLLGLNSIVQALPEALLGLLLPLGATLTGSATVALLSRITEAPAEELQPLLNQLAERGLVNRVPTPNGTVIYALHEMVHHFAQGWLQDSRRLDLMRSVATGAIIRYAEDFSADPGALAAELPNLLAATRTDSDSATARHISTAVQALADVPGYAWELRLLQSLAGPLEAPHAEELAGEELAGEDLAAEAAAEYFDEMDEIDAVPVYEAIDEGFTAPLEAEESVTPLPDAPPEPPPTFEETAPQTRLQLFDDSFFDQPVAAEAEEVDEAPYADAEGEEDLDIIPVPEYLPVIPLHVEEEAEDDDHISALSRAAADAGRPERAASTLVSLGQALLNQGRSDEAQEAFEQALALCEENDDQESMLYALEGLAGISLDSDDLENAVVYATRAENLAAQRGDPARLGQILLLLGDVRQELGSIAEASSTYERAVETLAQSSDSLSQGLAYAKLGNTYLDRGRFYDSIEMLEQARAIFERDNLTEYLMRVLGNLGTAYGQVKRWDEAETQHLEALAIARPLGDIEEQERQLANLAYLAQMRQDRATLVKRYRQALALAYSAGEMAWMIHYLDALGRLLMDDVSQLGVAIALLQEAEHLLPDEERARQLNRAQRRMERSGAQPMRQEDIDEWANAVYMEPD